MAPDIKAERGRLSVEMGVEAYKVTGARPARGAFASFARSEGTGNSVLESACGIGVLVEAGLISRLPGELHFEAARRELGRPYAEGFTHGFDGSPMPREHWPSETDRERMVEGYRDGQALWASVRDGVPSLVPDFPPDGCTSETIPSGAPITV